MFVNTGVPALIEQVCAAGAAKNKLSVKVAGGAAAMQAAGTDHFAIGKRNFIMLRKVLWQYNLFLDGEEIGGDCPRTMFLEVGSGRVWLNSRGQEMAL